MDLNFSFILWNNSLDILIEFKDLVNEINKYFQFTMEYKRNQLPLLDIIIMENGTNIQTDIFSKPTDSKHICFSHRVIKNILESIYHIT